MRISVLALSSAVLLGCAPGNPVTPAGTSLFEWDPSKATRATFKAATIGARTSKDHKVTLGRD